MKRTLLVAVLGALCLSSLVGEVRASDTADVEIVLEPFLAVRDDPALAERVMLHVGAELSSLERVTLLERDSLSALVDERTLGDSVTEDADRSDRDRGIRGAQYLLGGSVLAHEDEVHLFGKLISVADGRMRAFTARSRRDLLGGLAVVAASEVRFLVDTWVTTPTADVNRKVSRMAALASRLNGREKPTLSVHIVEQHHRGRVADRARDRAASRPSSRSTGRPIDPAAETEFLLFGIESGFPVVDKDPRFEEHVDVLILGEGFTEVSYRNGSALGVTARLEVKAVSRSTGRLLAVDRQTSVAVAGSELIGSKDALAKAAASVAERMLPKLVTGGP